MQPDRFFRVDDDPYPVASARLDVGYLVAPTSTPSKGEKNAIVMLRQVSFMSLQRMQALAANPNAVVISITDSSPRAVRPALHGYRDALRLEFLDIAEEHVCAAIGSWPLEPTTSEHERFSEHRGERLPALSDAVAIRQFLDAHHVATEPIEVLVHCHAGVSRSAAIAVWTAEHYGISLVDLAGLGVEEANGRLLRLLRQAA